MILHLLEYDVLELHENIPQAAIVITLLAKYAIYYWKEVLDDTIWEELNTLEVQLSSLNVWEANSYVLLLFLLVCHLLVFFVDFGRDTILFQGVDVDSDAK